MSAFKPRTRERNFLFSVVLTTAKMLFFLVLVLGVTGAGLLVGVAKAWVETSPTLDLSAFAQQAKTSFIYDRNGQVITDFKGSENRMESTFEELPKNLINAVIAIEDQRFFDHNGVDVRRIFGALAANLLSNKNQGGSTITQQLIKKTMLTDDQNFKRKLQEAYLALELEKRVNKQTILVEYMNMIPLGGSNYGVKVAAQDYFGKPLDQLSLRECAWLARTIRNPGRYNPRSAVYRYKNMENSVDQAGTAVEGMNSKINWVLEEMLRQNLITDAEYQQALAERPVVLEESQFVSKMYDNAYYVEYAISDVVTKMLRKEGNLEDNAQNRAAMEAKLRVGGYQIYTSLDPTVQQAVQDVVTNWEKYPDMRYTRDKTYKTKLGDGYIQLTQPQAAAVVMDWHTGELKAIVGGRSTPTTRKQLNRANPPGNGSGMPVGSSIKPLSVYGPAFDLGYSPGTPVVNAPLRIEGWNDGANGKGYPNNFGGSSFTGVESMRLAMVKSHNTATAQALYSYVGIENSVTYLKKLGVQSEHILPTGSGLALGSSGISPIEMAAAFGAIANEGTYLEPYAFTRVMDSTGSLYLDQQTLQVRREAFKPATAWLLVHVLGGCVSAQGTGAQANFGFQIAGKTGTNSDSRGVTFAGMSGYLSACVWVGHDGYRPLVSSATGGNAAAPLWAAVMARAHAALGYTQNRALVSRSAEDVGLVVAEACSVSGMRPTAGCLNDVNGYKVITDYYARGTQPMLPCTMHRSIRLCTKSMKAYGRYCQSVRSFGIIYLPEGSPLRYADIQEVRKYFRGASLEVDAAAIGVCTVCRSGSGAAAANPAQTEIIRNTIAKCQAQVDRANALLASGRMNDTQTQQLTRVRDYCLRAINAGSLSNMNKYGKMLMQLVNQLAQ